MTRSDGSGKPNGSASSGCIPGPDVSKISDLTAERVEHVFLHIPVLNQSTESPDVFVPTSRFCSFGSTMEQQSQRVRKGAEHHLLRKVSDA